MQLRICIVVFLIGLGLRGQYDHGTIDLGMGAVISIGLQSEVGFDVRAQYTTLLERYSYLLTYNRYFVQQTGNSEVLHELGVNFLVRIVDHAPFRLEAGVGYVINDYRVLRNARDTSDFYWNIGDHNHALQLKGRGQYEVSIPLRIFLEINFKSYGKRYDTIALGLTYSIGI